MSKYTVSASPQITSKTNSTRAIMLDVLIALVPALIAAIFFFGYHVAINVVVCAACCFGLEVLWSRFIRRDWQRKGFLNSTATDLSAVVTGVILALNMPAVVNVWGLNIISQSGKILFSFDTVLVCLVGSIVAIILVKQLFGGIGRNFANPAATARIFMLLTFGAGFMVSQTVGIGFDASTGATWLSGYKDTTPNILYNLFIGNVGSAAVGETCVIAILLGYAYLAVRKVIDWRLPLMILGWSAVFALLFDGAIASKLSGADLWENVFAHLMSGGLLFGAVFMATDYASSPNTFIGSCIYAFGIAVLAMLIRVFASYPEGMSFAIVIMNCVTPLIDKFVFPKPFGYVKPTKAKEERK